TRTVTLRNRAGDELQVGVDHPLSGALSWSPDGSALLAVASDSRGPSAIIDLTTDPPTVSEVMIPYDADWPTGTPQWSPITAPPLPAATAGTALDQDVSPAACCGFSDLPKRWSRPES
ncbi:MAG: hypothetical protein M3354_02895, partial [Chloroflexota bacterium]|nr:hypothetical protein [Chloroflexota bacterium]